MAESDIPTDAQTRAICSNLQKVVDGHHASGLQAGLFEVAIAKLREQDAELARHRSDRAYAIGHNDGWDAAFATGLTTDAEEEFPMDPNMFDGLGTALFVIAIVIALAAFGLGALIF